MIIPGYYQATMLNFISILLQGLMAKVVMKYLGVIATIFNGISREMGLAYLLVGQLRTKSFFSILNLKFKNSDR